jgi:parallel beta-helix repeat protein
MSALRPFAVAALLLPLLAPVPARAAVTKVASGVAADLQAAIDAAAPGDVIAVSGGPYVGNFTVPAGKDGLSIKGKVFIDAHEGGSGFTINSHDVTLSRLIIRHGSAAGITGPSVGPPKLLGLTIDRCSFLDVSGDAIDVTADDALVTGCLADGCAGGIAVSGDRAEVTRCTVLNDGDIGIEVTGADAQVNACTCTVIEDGNGIDVSGTGAQVLNNRVTNTDGTGIELDGADGVVSGNTVAYTLDYGIKASGDRVDVSKNKVSVTDSDGISVSGADVTVSNNLVQHVPDDDEGIDVSSSSGALIESNVVQYVASSGFTLSVGTALVRKNRATRCGAEDEYGFEISGSGNIVEANSAKDCDDTGFYVSGDDNELTGNKATGCGDNGFQVSGAGSTGNVLEGNKATGNDGEGLDNGGAGTTIRGNTFLKNLQDLANRTGAGASLVDDGGNVFKTGGLATEPAIP